VVRSDGNLAGLAFPPDAAMTGRIDRALLKIGGEAARAG